MIGIPAHNEENNIEKLLIFLIENCVDEDDSIYVVSSGSKDRTNDVVMHYSNNFSNVNLIVEDERNGKASAFNILLEILEENYEILVYMGADNIPEKKSIQLLINQLESKKIDAVGGRPVPVNNKGGIPGFFAHLLWNLHHLYSLEYPKISGELMAFKKGVMQKLPVRVVNDDLYIQRMLEKSECNLKYIPDAIVYLKGPGTISDFLRQRRRIFTGHLQIKALFEKKVETMRVPNINMLRQACPYFGVKGSIYALLFVLAHAFVYFLSLWDYNRMKIPYKWDMVKTSKLLD